MSNRCSICGKGHQTGNMVSHSNIKTHRRWKVNLCSVKAIIDGATRRIRVCSRCLRSNKVKRAI